MRSASGQVPLPPDRRPVHRRRASTPLIRLVWRRSARRCDSRRTDCPLMATPISMIRSLTTFSMTTSLIPTASNPGPRTPTVITLNTRRRPPARASTNASISSGANSARYPTRPTLIPATGSSSAIASAAGPENRAVSAHPDNGFNPSRQHITRHDDRLDPSVHAGVRQRRRRLGCERLLVMHDHRESVHC